MGSDPRVLWPLFLGLVFALMGGALAADAEAHAESALGWQRQTQPEARSSAGSLIWAYRAFGAGFAAAGLWLAGSWLFQRAALAERLGWAAAGPASGPGAGAALVLCGAGLSFLRSRRERPRTPAFVEAELPVEPVRLRRRAAAWCRRLIAALFVVYGTLLIFRSPT